MSELAAHWRWVALIWLEVVVAYGGYSLYLAARARRAERRDDGHRDHGRRPAGRRGDDRR